MKTALTNDNIPLSLYIHFPWCVRKCPYCDFNSHTLRGELAENEYINALIRDLDNDLPLAQERPLTSIFMGGGTPSLFSPKSMDRLLSAIDSVLPLSNDIEITLEANPGTVEQARFIGFRKAGISRLSMGIQSLQDDKLKTLGRIHSRTEALAAIDAAKQAGFDNFNLDIMFGLPNQTIEDALFDVRTALDTEPTHFSWYQLTIEPNTLFHHHSPILPDEELIWEMQRQGKSYLKNKGFRQYEVSAYAAIPKKPKIPKIPSYCQHNLNYWQFGDYLGIGAGAHSKITNLETGFITRYYKHKHPNTYLNNSSFIAGEQQLTEKDRLLEFMMNALRLYQPITYGLFEQRTGLQRIVLTPFLKMAKEKQWLEYDNKQCWLTEQGECFLNDVLGLLIN